MITRIIRGWWYGWQLQQALKQKKLQRASYLLKKLESLQIKLPLSARLYKQKLQADNAVVYYKQETDKLSRRLKTSDSEPLFREHPIF